MLSQYNNILLTRNLPIDCESQRRHPLMIPFHCLRAKSTKKRAIAFPQNFQTRKLGEISVFYEVDIPINQTNYANILEAQFY